MKITKPKGSSISSIQLAATSQPPPRSQDYVWGQEGKEPLYFMKIIDNFVRSHQKSYSLYLGYKLKNPHSFKLNNRNITLVNFTFEDKVALIKMDKEPTLENIRELKPDFNAAYVRYMDKLVYVRGIKVGKLIIKEIKEFTKEKRSLFDSKFPNQRLLTDSELEEIDDITNQIEYIMFQDHVLMGISGQMMGTFSDDRQEGENECLQYYTIPEFLKFLPTSLGDDNKDINNIHVVMHYNKSTESFFEMNLEPYWGCSEPKMSAELGRFFLLAEQNGMTMTIGYSENYNLSSNQGKNDSAKVIHNNCIGRHPACSTKCKKNFDLLRDVSFHPREELAAVGYFSGQLLNFQSFSLRIQKIGDYTFSPQGVLLPKAPAHDAPKKQTAKPSSTKTSIQVPSSQVKLDDQEKDPSQDDNKIDLITIGVSPTDTTILPPVDKHKLDFTSSFKQLDLSNPQSYSFSSSSSSSSSSSQSTSSSPGISSQHDVILGPTQSTSYTSSSPMLQTSFDPGSQLPGDQGGMYYHPQGPAYDQSPVPLSSNYGHFGQGYSYSPIYGPQLYQNQLGMYYPQETVYYQSPMPPSSDYRYQDQGYNPLPSYSPIHRPQLHQHRLSMYHPQGTVYYQSPVPLSSNYGHFGQGYNPLPSYTPIQRPQPPRNQLGIPSPIMGSESQDYGSLSGSQSHHSSPIPTRTEVSQSALPQGSFLVESSRSAQRRGGRRTEGSTTSTTREHSSSSSSQTQSYS